ncbi:MAG TPA: DUF2071 domain-containing protein [Herpetosiphonaceae bacterium]
MDYRTTLDKRLADRRDGWMDVRTRLLHFALITYALPAERLARHIPADRFEIPTWQIGGRPMALLSAVPFYDADFHFPRIAPWLKFGFGQTNHRAYVIDRRTGEHCVWFFGTTLGSPVVHIARQLWRIPWHPARYELECRYDAAARRYDRYAYRIDSAWGGARIDLADSGAPAGLAEGFASADEMQLVLTHPITGFFHRLDGKLGTYAVWHKELTGTRAEARDLHFSLYERLGLLSAEEMRHPYSAIICPEIEFHVYLPPRLA